MIEFKEIIDWRYVLHGHRVAKTNKLQKEFSKAYTEI